MEQLIELARRLGEQITRHERFTLLKQAQSDVNEDTEAKELIVQYQQHAEKIRQLEIQQKSVEVEDKHLLQNIEAKISTNEKLKELTRRQVDFVEMMQKIKKAIDDQLEKPQQQNK